VAEEAPWLPAAHVSPVPEGAGVRHRGLSPEGAQRAGQTVTDEPAARRARRLPPPTGGRAPRWGGDAGARAQAVSRARRQLTEALELVDEAIHILRSYVRENPDKAEKLEDILYTLEEAGEALDELVSAEEREGHR